MRKRMLSGIRDLWIVLFCLMERTLLQILLAVPVPVRMVLVGVLVAKYVGCLFCTSLSMTILTVVMTVFVATNIKKWNAEFQHGGAGTVPLRTSNSPSTCWIHKGRNRTKPNFMPLPPSQPCVCTALHKMFTIWTGQPGWHVPSWRANSWKSVPTGKSPCEVSSMNLPGKNVFWPIITKAKST